MNLWDWEKIKTENCLIYKAEYVIDGLAGFELKNYDRFEFQKYDCRVQILKIWLLDL